MIQPVLAGLLLAPGELAPLPFALATGIALNMPFAVLVKLGQDYLPSRPGTAAGVTLGLGVSVGWLSGASAHCHLTCSPTLPAATPAC